jgi:hypothetical protein
VIARTMNTPPRRNFGVGDGLILIAATAIGLAGGRGLASILEPEVQALLSQIASPPSGMPSIGQVLHLSVFLGIFSTPCISARTVACLLLRLQRPRRPLRRLARQPGALASFVATVVIMLTLAAFDMASVLAAPEYFEEFGPLIVFTGSLLLSPALLSGWATLALAGHWCPERTWIDRTGRLVGVLWIGLGMLCLVYMPYLVGLI